MERTMKALAQKTSVTAEQKKCVRADALLKICCGAKNGREAEQDQTDNLS
jgi:hypothetical protein